MSKQFQQYIESVVPERYTILQVSLLPLSCGHLILMNRFGCAFGSDDPNTKASFWDLFVAIAICCRKYNEFIEWYSDAPTRDKWLKKWFKSITTECKKNRNWNLIEKYALFNRYRKEGIKAPLYFRCNDDNDGATETGAHWIQNVMTFLITEGMYKENELLDMPLSKALNAYYKLLENKGRIALMQDWEIDEVERIEKEEKEFINA